MKEEFSQNINVGDTIIDVGAHIGEYTLLGAKLTGTKGSIIAIEPDPRDCEIIKGKYQIKWF